MMSHGVAVVIAFTISYLIVTAAHITVGEQVPKIYVGEILRESPAAGPATSATKRAQ